MYLSDVDSTDDVRRLILPQLISSKVEFDKRLFTTFTYSTINNMFSSFTFTVTFDSNYKPFLPH